jgi:hypothetical protein
VSTAPVNLAGRSGAALATKIALQGRTTKQLQRTFKPARSLTRIVYPYALLSASAMAFAVSGVIVSPRSALVTVGWVIPASFANRFADHPRFTRHSLSGLGSTGLLLITNTRLTNISFSTVNRRLQEVYLMNLKLCKGIERILLPYSKNSSSRPPANEESAGYM